MENPTIFISYSWDNEAHKGWVHNFANRLMSDGVNVILDRFYLRAGKNIPHFVENSMNLSERIIIILTPNYKLKAERRQGGVGQEYSIINNELIENIVDNKRIIPILKEGDKNSSIPAFLQQYLFIDFSIEPTFESQYEELLREIFDEPKIKIPKLGNKPSFEDKSELNLDFAPSLSLAIGYFNNFIKIVVIHINKIIQDNIPESIIEKTKNDLNTRKVVDLLRNKKNIQVKIVVPNNLMGANHKEFQTLFKQARLVKINIPSDSTRDMTVFVSPESMESSNENFIIYDIPTIMNSSIEAIDMVNPHKDIRELLSEKELRNFRKSILFKVNTTNDEHLTGINRLVTIIDIDEFKKDFMMD